MFEVKVKAPHLHRPRLEPEEARMSVIVELVEFRRRWQRADRDVLGAQFYVPVGIPVTHMKRQPRIYIDVTFNGVEITTIVGEAETKRVSRSHRYDRARRICLDDRLVENVAAGYAERLNSERIRYSDVVVHQESRRQIAHTIRPVRISSH